MIGRAAAVPLPETLRTQLAPPHARVSETAADYLRQSSTALMSRRNPPPLHPFAAALDCYLAEVADVRRLRLTRDLPVEAVERFFALGFALEQLRENFADLARAVNEYAPPPEAMAGAGGRALSGEAGTASPSRTRASQ